MHFLTEFGPSPRVRGKEQICQRYFPRTGTIPACAGQSPFPGWCGLVPSDHPRVCGAKKLGILIRPRWWGPSPRVRGKGASKRHSRSNRGTIPACAGQSYYARCCGAPKGDHPRVCGAKTSRPAILQPQTVVLMQLVQ